MCIPCSLEFSTEADFTVHKSSGHVDKSKGLTLVGPGVEPDPDFAATIARIEAKKNEPQVMTAPPVHSPRPELPELQAVQLIYKYTGDCPTCRTPVSTLELDLDQTHAVIAHCVKCNKQLEVRKEKKL